ncbi:hypothetical protein OG21DRAFT_1509194 [Imleria badia]|nr:hypothetical protein OG21DRAFT_1509194 [Imleria badia]
MIRACQPSRQPTRQPWTLERLLIERSVLLGLALDKSTSAAYSSALNSYLTFCHLHHFDPAPTIDTLSFYITFMAQHIEPRSIRSYLSGITSELEHILPPHSRGSPVICRHSHLTWCHRRFSRPIHQKSPLTKDHLLRIYNSLPRPFSHDDVLFSAILLSGFYGLLRLGEMV